MEKLTSQILENITLNEASHKSLFEYNLDATFIIDLNVRFIEVNNAAVKLSGYSSQELYQIPLQTIVVQEEYRHLLKYFEESLRQAQRFETVINHKKGFLVELDVMFVPIVFDNKTIGIYGIARDISKSKQMEKQLRHANLYDQMTGLYNRNYFKQEMQRIENERSGSIGLIICDVDGLKIVNNTLGHDKGDALLLAAAHVVKDATAPCDIVARIDGDEFAVLIVKGEPQKVQTICRKIHKDIDDYNFQTPELPLSISIGWAYRNGDSTELFKEAYDNMYREKLHHRKSTCSTLVDALMKTLEARDCMTEEHADRLQEAVTLMAKALELSDHRLADLNLLAKFHDIGKVGIPDQILFKPGPLTPQEFKEMQRHSEIGQRIANSASLFEPIADNILKHHEWWNGKGYPLGLREGEIPLECRILSIADAYDAMTHDRSYRKAMSHEEALTELKRWAGAQFDPTLVDLFIEIVNG
ncbi:diguanylate cyclase [Desulfosporosinus sp. Sb-LF]|uniref:bifunctional diguanylate cyclase/phosphohydrolase n=1 Tax=Desulfosporosinus sp. Sb-LF TaxID=2560027 RepID=UPI00107EEE06|nr:diguanylate cyclase [Desulfosporosinus sp. Sb-LF]TGE31217.1 diguanylate cyclase [Desulfosporosinus sp. Sb-LF]